MGYASHSNWLVSPVFVSRIQPLQRTFMSFFKHVQLHEYDITDLGITQACYDELVADGNNSDEKQLRILARAMCEEFKDYMRPLFS